MTFMKTRMNRLLPIILLALACAHAAGSGTYNHLYDHYRLSSKLGTGI